MIQDINDNGSFMDAELNVSSNLLTLSAQADPEIKVDSYLDSILCSQGAQESGLAELNEQTNQMLPELPNDESMQLSISGRQLMESMEAEPRVSEKNFCAAAPNNEGSE